VLDSDGEVVDPLNVLPLPLSGKSTIGLQTKTVVVSCNIIGTPGNLVTATAYSAAPSTLQLRGTAEALADLQNVTLDIPLSGISKSTTIRKRVRLPEGITSTFAGDPVVDVTITVREN
jgi:YbbR domain-containing protein